MNAPDFTPDVPASFAASAGLETESQLRAQRLVALERLVNITGPAIYWPREWIENEAWRYRFPVAWMKHQRWVNELRAERGKSPNTKLTCGGEKP